MGVGGARKHCWAGKSSLTPTSTSLTPPRPSPSTSDPCPIDEETEAWRGDRLPLVSVAGQEGKAGRVSDESHMHPGPLSWDIPCRGPDNTAMTTGEWGPAEGTSDIQDQDGPHVLRRSWDTPPEVSLCLGGDKEWPGSGIRLDLPHPLLPAGTPVRADCLEPWFRHPQSGAKHRAQRPVAVTGRHLTRSCSYSLHSDLLRLLRRVFNASCRESPVNRPSSLSTSPYRPATHRAGQWPWERGLKLPVSQGEKMRAEQVVDTPWPSLSPSPYTCKRHDHDLYFAGEETEGDPETGADTPPLERVWV